MNNMGLSVANSNLTIPMSQNAKPHFKPNRAIQFRTNSLGLDGMPLPAVDNNVQMVI